MHSTGCSAVREQRAWAEAHHGQQGCVGGSRSGWRSAAGVNRDTVHAGRECVTGFLIADREGATGRARDGIRFGDGGAGAVCGDLADDRHIIRAANHQRDGYACRQVAVRHTQGVNQCQRFAST